jgi:hypothetical protein
MSFSILASNSKLPKVVIATPCMRWFGKAPGPRHFNVMARMCINEQYQRGDLVCDASEKQYSKSANSCGVKILLYLNEDLTYIKDSRNKQTFLAPS